MSFSSFVPSHQSNARQRLRLLLATIAASLFVVSCSGDDNGGRDRDAPGQSDVNAITSGGTKPSERQLELIADGKVTFTEYEEAYFAYIQCVKDAGLKLRTEPQLDAHRQYYEGGSFSVGSSAAEAESNGRIIETCEVRHLLSVLLLWTAANRPSEELLQEANQALRDCLAERAIDMPPHLTADHFGALLQAAASGEPGSIPDGRSLDDISPLLVEHPDAAALFLEFLNCRERVGEQYAVGW